MLLLPELGLTPRVHEMCIYSGVIEGAHVIFKWQVDDFEIVVPN
jgi:hypothetical protein